jgi:hypothetical protein
MLAILNKLGSEAVQNFKRVVDLDRLGRMSLDEARQLCNFQIWDVSGSRKIFDIEDGTFPNPKLDSIFYKNIEEHQHKGLFGLRLSSLRLFDRKKQHESDKRESLLSIEIPLREF